MLVEDVLEILRAQQALGPEAQLVLARLADARRGVEVILRDEYAAVYEVLGVDHVGQLRVNEIIEAPGGAVVVDVK